MPNRNLIRRALMSHWRSTLALNEAAQKWRALAERRRAHFVEFYHTKRWKRYYDEEQFLLKMREAIKASDRWAEIAPTLPDFAPRLSSIVGDLFLDLCRLPTAMSRPRIRPFRCRPPKAYLRMIPTLMSTTRGISSSAESMGRRRTSVKLSRAASVP
jgi:uncharacterized repeat protein (TIGR03809 family)